MIMNKMYETQHIRYIVPRLEETAVVCVSIIFPVANGCVICVNFFQNVSKTLGLSVVFQLLF